MKPSAVQATGLIEREAGDLSHLSFLTVREPFQIARLRLVGFHYQKAAVTTKPARGQSRMLQ
jgi:hypothetical protein